MHGPAAESGLRTEDRSGRSGAGALSGEERRAAAEFIRAVRRRVPAELVQASLFGSAARGEAGPDSDLDILLVFSRLPPDREPHATIAEELADRVARESRIPVTTWSVSLVDLECGNRTPMLVDALEDSIPLWWRRRPLPPLSFTPRDALSCVDSLLQRTREGSAEFAARLARGEAELAARRARDDLVRLCTAGLLLRGITRPRRGAAVRSFRRLELLRDPPPPRVLRVLRWAEDSYGPDGRDEDAAVRTPPGGLPLVAEVVEGLRRGVIAGAERLARTLEARRGERYDGNGTCAHLYLTGPPPDPSPAIALR
jgi:predicted nucleotidyltransferase